MRSPFRFWLPLSLVTLAACRSTQPAAPAAPPADLAIQDVSLVEVDSGRLRPHATVVVRGDRIVAVGDASSIRTPRGSRVIDGRGRFLIPGLWDMHSHSLWSDEAARTFLPLYVAAGVTGIRDMGGTLEVLAAARERWREGKVPSPRLYAAGVILDGPEPVQRDVSVAIADAAAARAKVDTLAASGVDFLKVYTLLPREAYFAVIAEARRVGLPVAGHVPADVTVEEASRAGQRSIEHLRDELEPLCVPGEVEACERLAALFRQQRTWQVPTLVTLRAKAFTDEPAFAADARLGYLPAALRQEWLAERESRLRRGIDYFNAKRQRFAGELWLTHFLADQQVGLLAGTDAGVAFCYPGFSLHDELALLVQAGLTPQAALRSATLSPAEFLGQQDAMGSIAPGKVADLVLLGANPLLDIAATREIEAVLLRGRLLLRGELDGLRAAVAGAVR